MVQKYPPNSHVLIMEHSSNYGEISSPIIKTSKADYQNNYSTPFYIRHGTSTTDSDTDTTVNGYSNPPEAYQQHEDDFFKSMKSFLIFGKLIGVLPYSGIFGNSWRDMSFRKKSFSSAMSYGILAVLIFNAIMGVIQSVRSPKRNALEISNSIRATLFYIWGCLIYINFMYKGQMFLHIFKMWTSIKVVYSRKDKTLRRDTFLIGGAILTSALLENSVLHLEYFKGLDKISGKKYDQQNNNMTELETYYWRAHYHWATVIGYNWFLAILGFIQHKWILYAWNYMDIVVAVFGRAMYFRFKCLYEEAEKKLLGPEELRLNNSRQGICNDHGAWVQVVYDHQNLCRLLEVLENFFSPVVFASYAVNMFYICVQLLDGLTSELSSHSVVHSIYAPWSFLHLVMRAFIVSICCARINVYAHKIRNILQECPLEHYSTEISRVDKRVTAGPDIGFTGLGCFTVTKPFILSILSVVFTFEIVLLQCVPSNTPTPAPTNCQKS